MNRDIVLVPGAPVIVPELSGTAHGESRRYLDAMAAMLVDASRSAQRVEVWGDDRQHRHVVSGRSSLRRWGVDVPVGSGTELPDPAMPDVALLGWWLLDRAGVELPRTFVPVSTDPTAELDSRAYPPNGTMTVVVADGPAALAAKAPIPRDERAVELNHSLIGWLRDGTDFTDPGAVVADEIGWWSRLAWLRLRETVAATSSTTPIAEADGSQCPAMSRAIESYSWAPFGVGYHCARWRIGR